MQMHRGADAFISNNERDIILKGMREELRLDGRKPLDPRPVTFQFALDDSSATVQLGSTRVAAVISAELEAPYNNAPTEGTLRFNVELSPMASPAFEPGRPGEDAIEIGRLVEWALKQSRAVDVEALCVLAGRKVWHLRVDIHVLDHKGNLVDACCLAALAALLAFRKPEVSVGGASGSDIIIHSPEVKEPTPLSIHHLPLCFTFAIFEDGNVLALDPTLQEEASMQGSVTIIMNPNKELCTVQKADGLGLQYGQLMRAMRLVSSSVEDLAAKLRSALEAHQVARVAARVRRHKAAAALPAGAAAVAGGGEKGRRVVVMGGREDADRRIAALMAEIKSVAEREAMQESSSSEEDASDGEASSSGNEDGMEQDTTNTAAGTSTSPAAAAAGAAGARGGQQKARLSGGVGAGARLAGGTGRQAGASATFLSPDGSGGLGAAGARGSGAKRRSTLGKPQQRPAEDRLDAIAAIIAGAAAGEGPVTDLAAAIKAKPGKKAKRLQQ